MLKQDQLRKKYPSDLTDEQWAIVEPLLPPAKQRPRGGHPRTVDMREVLNTIFYLNRSGCQWDMLPHLRCGKVDRGSLECLKPTRPCPMLSSSIEEVGD